MIVCNITAEFDPPPWNGSYEDSESGAVMIKLNGKIMAKVPCPYWKSHRMSNPPDEVLTEAVIQWMTAVHESDL